MRNWQRKLKPLLAIMLAVGLLLPGFAVTKADAADAPENLIKDGSFEEQSNAAGVSLPWEKWGDKEAKAILNDSEGAQDGASYMAVKIDWSQTSVHQAVEVEPNRDYSLSVWLKLDSTENDALINIYDTAGDWSTLSANLYSAVDDESLRQWKQETIVFNSGSATQIEVQIGGGRGGESGGGKWVYIDHVALSEAVGNVITPMNGTPFGLPDVWNDSTYDKMFDGKTDTIYDYKEPSGGYGGLDLGESNTRKVVKLRFFPRDLDWVIDQRMVGGKFQGSNLSPDSGYEDLYVIDSHVHRGWNTVYLDPEKQKTYRYVRYLSADNGYVNMAEVQFYGAKEAVGLQLNHLEPAASSVTMLRNETRLLPVTGVYADQTTRSVTAQAVYRSSDPAVVAVSSGGVLTARDFGDADIGISLDGVSTVVHVQVNPLPSSWKSADILSGAYAPLTGTPFGSNAGTWNGNDDYDTVFDGDTSTFFDSKQESGAFAGLDFGEPKRFNKIRFYPRSSYISRAVNVDIQGSIDGTDYQTIVVTRKASAGWNEIVLPEAVTYRYVRYISPASGYGNMAEMQFLQMPASSSSFDGLTKSVTIEAYGTGVGATKDSFHFISTPLNGSGSLSAKLVEASTPAASGALAGITLRTDADSPDAPFVMLAVDEQGRLVWQQRSAQGAAAVSQVAATVSLPLWLRIDRTGDRFTALTSADGVSWTEQGTLQLALPALLQAGLAASSGSEEASRQVVFNNPVLTLANVKVTLSANEGTDTTSFSYALNGFSGLNPESVAATGYQEGLKYMKPGLFRLHSWEMMGDSKATANGWLDTTHGDAWDADKIKRVLTNLSLDGQIMINIPSWPESMDVNPGNGVYEMLDPAKYEAFAEWCAELVRITNGDPQSQHKVTYWEVTNERDDMYYVDLVNNGKPQQMAELAKIYNLAVKRMKDVDPAIKTGGPAFARPDLIPSVQTFIDGTVDQKDAPGLNTLDFLSYHFYGSGDKSDPDEKIYNRANELYTNTLKIRKLLNQSSPQRPISLFLDEYNVSWSYQNNDPRMLNAKGGVFDALVMVNAHNAGADGTLAWNEKDGIYGKMDAQNKLRPPAQVFHLFNSYLIGKQLDAASSAADVIVPFVVKSKTADQIAVALINRSDDERSVELASLPSYKGLDRYELSMAGYKESPGTVVDLSSLTLPANSVTVLVLHDAVMPKPTTDAPYPVIQSPGATSVNSRTLTVKDPQADNGLIDVVVSKEISEVKLPASAGALNGSNALRIHGEGFSAVIPAAVLQQLQAMITKEQSQDAFISFRFERAAPEDRDRMLGKVSNALKGAVGANVSVQAAGDFYDFGLTILTGDGERHPLTQLSEPVLVTLPLSEQADPNLSGMYAIADNGKLAYIRGRLDGSSLTAGLLHFSSYALLSYNQTFSDVGDGHWASAAIKGLAARDVVRGVDNSRFEPGRPVTRAEFTALLARVLGLKAATGTAPFTDVGAGKWYDDAVTAAWAAGLVKGTETGQFRPADLLSREEMAVLLVRAYEYASGSKLDRAASSSYADQSTIHEWARAYVNAAASIGLLQGRDKLRFDPLSSTTRAESAMAVIKLIQL